MREMTMADFIDRKQAIKCAEESYKMWNLTMAGADGEREINKCYKMQELCKTIDEVFKIVPAADVAPVVHGRWIAQKGDETLTENGFVHGPRYSCNNCGWGVCCATKLDFNYCPNCGATMDEEG